MKEKGIRVDEAHNEKQGGRKKKQKENKTEKYTEEMIIDLKNTNVREKDEELETPKEEKAKQ